MSRRFVKIEKEVQRCDRCDNPMLWICAVGWKENHINVSREICGYCYKKMKEFFDE